MLRSYYGDFIMTELKQKIENWLQRQSLEFEDITNAETDEFRIRVKEGRYIYQIIQLKNKEYIFIALILIYPKNIIQMMTNYSNEDRIKFVYDLKMGLLPYYVSFKISWEDSNITLLKSITFTGKQLFREDVTRTLLFGSFTKIRHAFLFADWLTQKTIGLSFPSSEISSGDLSYS